MKKNKNVYNDSGIVFIMIFVMLISVFILYLAYDSFKWLQSPNTIAKLESCDTVVERDDNNDIVYDGKFTYVVEGSSYEAIASVTSKECKNGTTKELYYNKTNPKEHRIGNVLLHFILLLIIGLALLIISIGIIISCIKDRKKKKEI